MEAVKTLIEQHRPVLLIDAFQTGPTPVPRDESARHFLAFNRTADANRVQDILTALAFLDRQRAGEVDLLGEGDARIWCLFAAAIAPVRVRLATPADDFRGTDEEFITRFFVPGIQRAGGLQAALRLVAR
jgi:hypothetical protein